MNADTSFSILRHRRSGSGCGDGGIHHRWSMRVGRLPDEDTGKTLARCSKMERHSDADRREFL